MLLTEYDEVEQMKLFKEDGIKEGRMLTLMEFVQKGLLSIKDAAAQASISEEAFIKKMADQSSGRRN